MTVNHLTDEDLVNAWISGVPAESMANQLNVTSRWLHEQWRRLRLDGSLPDERRSFEFDEWDGRPSVHLTKNRDLLLERLRKVHKIPRYDVPRGLN
jgi:hypothetical protein